MRKIRKGDEIIVLSGKNKGSRGKVLAVLARGTKVVVAGVNLVKKHVKAKPNENKPGVILDKEMPLSISKVSLYNVALGRADRVGFRKLENGKKIRYFKSNGELIDI